MKKLIYLLTTALLSTVIISIIHHHNISEEYQDNCPSCQKIYNLQDHGMLTVSPENILHETYIALDDSITILIDVEIGLGPDYLMICPKCEANPFLLNEESIIRFMKKFGCSEDYIKFARQEIERRKIEFRNNAA